MEVLGWAEISFSVGLVMWVLVGCPEFFFFLLNFGPVFLYAFFISFSLTNIFKPFESHAAVSRSFNNVMHFFPVSLESFIKDETGSSSKPALQTQQQEYCRD